MRALILASALMAATPLSAQAQVCKAWSSPVLAASIPSKPISEASGLEASRAYPGRLYHTNDSGDGLRFYITNMAGGGLQTVNLKGPKPADIEELSLGPCGSRTCLYLGDVGDNAGARSEVSFTLLAEKKTYAETEAPLRVVRARYPDGPRNVEAFALHPNGDLFVVTKPVDARVTNPGPASVYRLSANQLRQTQGVQVFAMLGELDLPKLLSDLPFYGWIPTGLDISRDGKRAVLLTYMAVVELGFDLAKGVPAKLTAGDNVSVFRAPPLAQQEAITLLPDDSGFLYDSEAARKAETFPLHKVICQGR
ncbi:MAG: hypothetical protein Q8K11_11800 [Phenylobacterium sp.]|uniref:hypothetical protein n=1 Tax=Phenylobacterium sp. TaxID=1871053 RepID=UPI00272F38D2|nr:hypothetical protein [Phenylobacterium sp.]MDP2010851.1 hypothetical protein [Phenylobacterium sp.]